MTWLHCLIYSQKSIFQHSIIVPAPLQTWCILLISVRSSSPTALERLITKNSSPQTSKTKEHVTATTDQTLISEIWGRSVSAKQESLGKAIVYFAQENSWTGVSECFFPEPALLLLCDFNKSWLLGFSIVIGTIMGWDHKTPWHSCLRSGDYAGNLTSLHQLYFFFFCSSKCKGLSIFDVWNQKLLFWT